MLPFFIKFLLFFFFFFLLFFFFFPFFVVFFSSGVVGILGLFSLSNWDSHEVEVMSSWLAKVEVMSFRVAVDWCSR